MTETVVQMRGTVYENGYGLIAKKVMRDRRLSIKAKAVYSYLCSFAGSSEDRVAFPGVKTMLDDLQISKDSFYKYRKELETLGYITIEERRDNGRYESNIYYIEAVPCPKISDTEKSDTEKSDTIISDTNNNKSFNKNSPNKNKRENKNSQSVNSLPKTIATTIEKNGLTDRLGPISKVYDSVKDTTGYSDALFIQTLLKTATLKEASNNQKNNLAFERYLRKAILTNISEQHAAAVNGTGRKGLIEDKLPASVQKQLERESKGVATSDEKKKLKDYPELQNMLDKLREDQKEVV